VETPPLSPDETVHLLIFFSPMRNYYVLRQPQAYKLLAPIKMFWPFIGILHVVISFVELQHEFKGGIIIML
jgi:hypothetical protein